MRRAALIAGLLLAAARPALAQPAGCYYMDWLGTAQPAPCPERAAFPDHLPPPPHGTLWLPAANLPHVYKAERLVRDTPHGPAFEVPSGLEGAALPAIRAQPDGRIVPARYPDGPRPDGGREEPAARAPGGRFCHYVVLIPRDAAGNFYGESAGPCPEDHATRHLGAPPPGRMWVRHGDGPEQMSLASFVVPSSAMPPPDAPPGPVPLLRAATETPVAAKPVPAPSAARETAPAEPRDWTRPAAAKAKPESGPGPGALAGGALVLVVMVGVAAYLYGRKRGAAPAPRGFASSAWNRANAKTVLDDFPPPLPAAAPSAAETAAPTGGVLGGRYELRGKIGEGGMGVVYEGLDRTLGRRVAIKMMRSEIARGDGARDAFLSEARIISHLSHPYIVAIHEVIENPEGIYLVFDFVDGEPLSEVLKKRQRLPLAECVSVFSYVCEAIACAHRSRVLHRDLKPSNIMIDKAGYAKVMDFGIAREAKDGVTRSTNLGISGTLAYMAPEQHLGRGAKTSDIYALGVCLYQAMTGSLPFPGPDFLAQKERMKYVPPQFLAPDLPKEAELLFAATLSADPKLRVADASELIDSLKSLL